MDNEFNIPLYLVEEIVEYVEETAKGRCRCMKFENIKALLGMAKVNRRINRATSKFFNRKIQSRKFAINYI